MRRRLVLSTIGDRGLALARRLAESDGGRLELVKARPATLRLTLLPITPGVRPQA